MIRNSFFKNVNNTNSTTGEILVSPRIIISGCLLSCCSLLTILGNSLVIISVMKERYLRSVTNYFIVSLASADLVMGTLVMPFAISEEILQGVWIYGPLWCDFWHATDVWSSTCSILNLCAIAVERYYATHNPILHAARISKQRSCFTIAGIWLFSAIISFPAIFWWQAKLVYPRNVSECSFTTDRSYLLLSSILSFYMPLFIMIFVYYKIYKIATATLRSLKSGFRVIKGKSDQGDNKIILNVHRGGHFEAHSSRSPSVVSPLEVETKRFQVISPVNSEKISKQEKFCQERLSFQQNTLNLSNYLSPRSYQNSVNLSKTKSSNLNKGDSRYSLCIESNVEDSSTQSRSSITSPVKVLTNRLYNIISGKKTRKILRDQRAAKTLGIVMGIFVLCWLPFFVCNILVAIDKRIIETKTATSKIMLTIVTWLGYVNSSINPIIYAHSMREFRASFLKILSCYDIRTWWNGNMGSENARKMSAFTSDICKSRSMLGLNMMSASSTELHFKDESKHYDRN